MWSSRPSACCCPHWASARTSWLTWAIASHTEFSLWLPSTHPAEEGQLDPRLFPTAQAPTGPCIPFSPYIGPYESMFLTLARGAQMPFSQPCEVPGYISPTVLFHWPPRYLYTNFLVGTSSKEDSNPIQIQQFQILVRQPYKIIYILQAKPVILYLSLIGVYQIQGHLSIKSHIFNLLVYMKKVLQVLSFSFS